MHNKNFKLVTQWLTQWMEYRKGKRVMLQWRHHTETSLTKWSRWTSPMISILRWVWVKRVFPFFVFFPQIHIFSLIMQKRKNDEANTIWGTVYRIFEKWSLKSMKVMKKQGRLDTVTYQGRLRRPSIKYNLGPRINPKIVKRMLVRNWWNLSKICS